MKIPFNTLLTYNDFPCKELFIGANYPWDVLQNIETFFAMKVQYEILSPIPSGVFLVNQDLIHIAPNVTIESGAFIEGPVYIGEGSVVRSGAYIRGFSVFGSNCVVGHGTEVKRSVFLNGAKAAHLNYVGDSVLGKDVNLGAGVKCANYRFDKKLIEAKYENEHYETGMKKVGAFIGDRVSVGCNAVLNPGVVIGYGARCFPGTVVSGWISANAVHKGSRGI